MHSLLLYLLLGLTQTLAHNHPETEHEIEVQRALQAAAYHVSLKLHSWLLFLMMSALVCTSYRVIHCLAEASLGTTGACRFSCRWPSVSSPTPAPILSWNIRWSFHSCGIWTPQRRRNLHEMYSRIRDPHPKQYLRPCSWSDRRPLLSHSRSSLATKSSRTSRWVTLGMFDSVLSVVLLIQTDQQLVFVLLSYWI